MRDNKQIMCDECKNLVLLSEIKYSQKGNQTLKMCSDCRNRTTSRKNKEILSKNMDIKMIPEEKKEIKSRKKISPDSNKSKYLCTRCKYKFNYDPAKGINLKCPYCSSSAYVTSFKSLSPNKLLKEVKGFD